MKKLLLVTIFLMPAVPGLARADLYKATLVRAAPGELLELIEFYKSHFRALETAGDARPFWMRHSQGDQWDLLILFPISDFARHYSPEQVQRRSEALKRSHLSTEEIAGRWRQLIAWHEDVLVEGPPLTDVKKALQGGGFFHVEMFRALPGRYADLLEQRRMENLYLAELNRPRNLLFRHREGAAWDCFTIGPYRDLKHFAESADIPEEREDGAAKKAGFESASAIGPYLRTLIAEHHDTLAVAVQ